MCVCPVQLGLVCIVGLELTEAAGQLQQMDPALVYAFKVDGECGAPGGSVDRVSDISSGHDFTVHELENHIGLDAVSVEPSLNLLSPSFCPCSACILCFSKISKHEKMWM